MEFIRFSCSELTVLLLVVVALTALVTSLVWRWLVRNDKLESLERLNMLRLNMNFNHKKEMQEKHLEHQKQRLMVEKQAKKALSRVDLVYAILHCVQAVHQGIDSSMRVIVDSNLAITVSNDDWEQMCHATMSRSNLLRDLVDCSIEVLQYENIADVPLEDDVLIIPFCQDMFGACERYLKNDKIDLNIETDLDDDFTVRTHMGYLRKLIKNLLICSMVYTNNGFIKMCVSADEKRGLIKFALYDTGLGIPEDVLEHVFERLPNDGDMKNLITGVRLRIAYALAHLLGGTIYVDTQYTGGTSIVFTVAKN